MSGLAGAQRGDRFGRGAVGPGLRDCAFGRNHSILATPELFDTAIPTA